MIIKKISILIQIKIFILNLFNNTEDKAIVIIVIKLILRLS